MTLPSGYTKLEYIESTGTAYINTGFKPNSRSRIICDFQMNAPSGWEALLGASDNTGNTNSVAFWHTPSNGFAHYYGTEQFQAFGVVTEGVGTGTRNVIDLNKNVATLSRGDKSYIVYTNSVSAFSCSQPIYLFGVNYGGTQRFPNPGCKIFGCKIYSEINSIDVIQRNFIPCKNTSGVIGLWDDTEYKFYANAGTGTFNAGQPLVDLTAHKTLINGTAYTVQGGKCMVDGTVYNILKGRTLIDGTGWDIAFPSATPVETVTLQLSGSYWGSSRYASVDGQTLTAAGSYQVTKGATVTLTMTPLSPRYPTQFYFNTVREGEGSQYVFRATANAEVALNALNFSELYCNITMPS